MKLRDWLEINCVDRGRFVKRLGMERTSLYLWETGRSRPTYENLKKLTEATNGQVTIDDFIAHTEELEQAGLASRRWNKAVRPKQDGSELCEIPAIPTGGGMDSVMGA